MKSILFYGGILFVISGLLISVFHFYDYSYNDRELFDISYSFDITKNLPDKQNVFIPAGKHVIITLVRDCRSNNLYTDETELTPFKFSVYLKSDYDSADKTPIYQSSNNTKTGSFIFSFDTARSDDYVFEISGTNSAKADFTSYASRYVGTMNLFIILFSIILVVLGVIIIFKYRKTTLSK